MANNLFAVGTVSLNVLALSVENVKRLQEITDNKVIVGVMAKDIPDDQQLLQFIGALGELEATVSLGLGGGDPSQAARVAKLAVSADPHHINQVFPLAGYTQGLVAAQRLKGVVNALVAPGPDDDTVILSTGAGSALLKPALADCATAAAMIAEMNVQAVKFFPMNDRIENMVNLAASCAKEKIPIFEPTGGIDLGNVGEIVKRCLDAGAEIVIPHVYSSLVKNGSTDYATFALVWRLLQNAQ